MVMSESRADAVQDGAAIYGESDVLSVSRRLDDGQLQLGDVDDAIFSFRGVDEAIALHRALGRAIMDAQPTALLMPEYACDLPVATVPVPLRVLREVMQLAGLYTPVQVTVSADNQILASVRGQLFLAEVEPWDGDRGVFAIRLGAEGAATAPQPRMIASTRQTDLADFLPGGELATGAAR